MNEDENATVEIPDHPLLGTVVKVERLVLDSECLVLFLTYADGRRLCVEQEGDGEGVWVHPDDG